MTWHFHLYTRPCPPAPRSSRLIGGDVWPGDSVPLGRTGGIVLNVQCTVVLRKKSYELCEIILYS